MNESSNERFRGGNRQVRRFAYLHKKDHDRFGILEAVDLRDARNYLGKEWHVRTTWLTDDETSHVAESGEAKWEIVSSIFLSPMSAAFIGHKK